MGAKKINAKIFKEMAAEGKLIEDIAKHFGCTESAISGHAAKHKIEIKRKTWAKKGPSASVLYTALNRANLETVAKEYSVSTGTVAGWAKDAGLKYVRTMGKWVLKLAVAANTNPTGDVAQAEDAAEAPEIPPMEVRISAKKLSELDMLKAGHPSLKGFIPEGDTIHVIFSGDYGFWFRGEFGVTPHEDVKAMRTNLKKELKKYQKAVELAGI